MRNSFFRALVLVSAPALFCTTLSADAQQAGPAYLVIVNPKNPTTTVDRKFLADAFLKKATSWPDGVAIRPVDLAPDSAVRRKFSEDVLKRSVEAVRSYWQQRIFAGQGLPPPELDRDQDVVEYIRRHEGAVGYVSPGAALQGSKVLRIN
jgi:ABC-type phosphate transport system substrate-binding protein